MLPAPAAIACQVEPDPHELETLGFQEFQAPFQFRHELDRRPLRLDEEGSALRHCITRPTMAGTPP